MKLGAYLSQGRWRDCQILEERSDGIVCREERRDLAGVFLAARDRVRIVVGELYLPPENSPRPRLQTIRGEGR